MLLLLLITAMAFYIYRFADIDECSCIPSEDGWNVRVLATNIKTERRFYHGLQSCRQHHY